MYPELKIDELDYIISVITEEFGSIISIFLILIFLYISLRIIKVTVS